MVNKNQSLLGASFLPPITLAAIVLVFILFRPSQAASNGTYTVNTTADTDDGTCDGAHCSLREAINAANTAAGADTITFTLPPTSTIMLTANQLPIITDTLTIDGSTAANLTIMGAGDPGYGRVLQIGSDAIVTIKNLTISNGITFTTPGGAVYNEGGTLIISNSTFSSNIAGFNYGGGIYSDGGVLIITNSNFSGNNAEYGGGAIGATGTLVINNSIFNNNSNGIRGGAGGGILTTGTATISNSIFKNNEAFSGYPPTPYASGGGIFNSGTLTISDSTFNGNSANVSVGFGIAKGGGIFNSGTLTITNTTFSGNSAAIVGSTSKSHNSGPSLAEGGGIVNQNGGLVSIRNSTVSGNLAVIESFGLANSGGIANNSGSTLSVNNSTISDNSAVAMEDGTIGTGGLENSGTLHLLNTIIANSVGNGDCVNSGIVGTNINNLVEDGSCNPAFSGDPLLGPLQSNGGQTPTHAPLPGSPVIDNGDNGTCEQKDQRGVPRPIDGDENGSVICDIGSVEVGGKFMFTPLALKAAG